MHEQAAGPDRDHDHRVTAEPIGSGPEGDAARVGEVIGVELAEDEAASEPGGWRAWLRLPVWRYLGTALLILGLLLIIGLVCSPRYFRF